MALKKFSNAEMLEIAEKTISKIRGKVELTHKDGDTTDIVNNIVSNAKTSAATTQQFAQYMRGASGEGTGLNTWNFVKQNIKYVLDPYGVQYIKSPAYTFKDKYSDCKSYSIFIESVLRNLGIKCAFRFVSYSDRPIYTHVYVVAFIDNKEVILDCCMNAYNKEKPYKFKLDISMSKIYQMSGTQDNIRTVRDIRTKEVKKVINLGNKSIDEMTAGEMDLYLARERMKAEKAAVERMSGIGSIKAEKYQNSIDMLNDAIEHINDPNAKAYMKVIDDDIVSGAYNMHRKIGVGKIFKSKEVRKAAAAVRKDNRQQKVQSVIKKVTTAASTVATKTGAFIQKAADKAAQGIKAVVKVVTAPQRLIVKAILEVTLPKAAPFFLYLFINDQKIIAKLPTKARNKRKKAERIADFIVNVIGMKREHFMSIIRTGIIKQTGKSPETILSGLVKGKISGIGFIPPGTIGAVMEIISKIVEFFKKGKTPDLEVSESDAPSEMDFEGMSDIETTELSTDIKKQSDTPAYETPGETIPKINRGTLQAPKKSKSTLLNKGGKKEVATQDNERSVQDEGGHDSTGQRKTWNSLG